MQKPHLDLRNKHNSIHTSFHNWWTVSKSFEGPPIFLYGNPYFFTDSHFMEKKIIFIYQSLLVCSQLNFFEFLRKIVRLTTYFCFSSTKFVDFFYFYFIFFKIIFVLFYNTLKKKTSKNIKTNGTKLSTFKWLIIDFCCVQFVVNFVTRVTTNQL